MVAIFRPGEETAQGARAMIEDGLVKKFPKPDVTIAQYMVPAPGCRSVRAALRPGRHATDRRSHFALVIEPTLRMEIAAMLTAADVWLDRGARAQ